jgi:hypothetical protein
MTTRKKPQGAEEGKSGATFDLTPKQPTPERALVVTPDEAETLVRQIRGARMDGSDLDTDKAVGAFLLLLHSMAYCDPADREDYLRAAESVLLVYTFAFQSAAHDLRESAFDALRGDRGRAKGGA